jgi:hypothetical protein
MTMAKQKKAATANEGLAIWKPTEQGQALEGKFVQFQDSSTGMFIILSSGVVGLGTILRKLVKTVYKDLTAKDTIKIVYTGKAGRAKMFDLYLNNKQIIPAFDIAKPAPAVALTQFFSDDFEFPVQGQKKKGYAVKE